MAEFIDAVADDLVASGIGVRYATSGVSIQVNHRRSIDAPHVVLLNQTGGQSFPWAFKEQQGIQVLVDSVDLVSGRDIARRVYDQLHERIATDTFSGFEVLWMRSTSGPPQVVPQSGRPERFFFSVNFDALLVRNPVER